MKDIYYKLKDIILIGLYGLTVGAILSFVMSAYIHFVLLFKIVSICFWAVIAVLNLVQLKIFSHSIIWAGIILRTILIHFVFLGSIGSIWFYVAEDYEVGGYENLLIMILTPTVILATTLIFLFRYVWYESTISKKLEENIKIIKFLLSFKKY